MNKRRIKKLFCIFFVCAYIFGSVASTNASLSNVGLDSLLEDREKFEDESTSNKTNDALSSQSFKDIEKSDWFYKYVDLLVKDSLITGTSDTEFSPNDAFSVSQSCAVICRYLGLEDTAQIRRNTLVDKNKKGAQQWYSGYMQVMYDCNILESVEFFTADKDGLIDINTLASDRPIKRHEFALMIAKSFELDGSLRAKNSYHEISGLGHEFISGGIYDMTAVNDFKYLIKDYDFIPDLSKQAVLKGYYNGIFCGDESANFNPIDNLSRAEMAKILCVIYDLSQREFLQSDYSLKGADTSAIITDDEFEPFKLPLDKTQSILFDELSGLDVSSSFLTYNSTFSCPSGFAFEIYVYSVGGHQCELISSYTLANRSADQSYFSCAVTSTAKATLLLRNLYQNGRIEGYIDVDISNDKITNINHAISYPVF